MNPRPNQRPEDFEPSGTPLYDHVRAEAMIERMFADKVEADLKAWTERGTR